MGGLDARRHDLDALRGFAMLLGIALHAGLSLTPFPWPVQDAQQNEIFGLFFAAVHGFRMPLFFLLSGFFTAMLWRGRGIKALLTHRFRRVFLPLLLGLVTIVPAILAISGVATTTGFEDGADATKADDIWGAAAQGDLDALERHIAGGADIDGLDPAIGSSPLASAALFGHTDAVALLLDKGADIDRQNKDGSTALHSAAFLGRIATAELLLQRGARTDIINSSEMTPAQSATVNWEITRFITGMLRIEIDEAQIKADRLAVIDLLGQYAPKTPAGAEPRDTTIGSLITSPWFTIPVFHHLWFLWFLCWLVVGFGAYALVVDKLGWRGPPDWLVLSPARFLWLIPLTMVPQWFMGRFIPSFGPDTAIGLLPMPHILAYYAIFFGFGALYYDSADHDGRVGRGWPFALPIGVLVVFPLGLELSTNALGFSAGWFDEGSSRLLAVALQVIYAWMISFACMGLFRRYCGGESYKVRYLSDASYWLYVAHLPLILGAQLVVRDWPLSPFVKFTLICLVVTGFLLIVYQTLVRYRWLGKFLNGPRTRPAA